MNDVPLVYVDTSALGALLVAQPETQELVDWLDQADARLVSCDLLETELRRMAVREGRDQSKVSEIVDGVSLAAFARHHRALRGGPASPKDRLKCFSLLT